jgi:hypothetical protein
MSTFNKLYERTIARLLADHTGKAIPSDLDLWATIQARIVEREDAVERASEDSYLRSYPATLTPQAQIPGRANAPRLLRHMSALGGVALFAGLAILTVFTISGLANRAVSKNPQAAGDSQLLFSIPLGEDHIKKSDPGFDVAEDGSFWVGFGGNLGPNYGEDKILHFSPAGELLGALNPTPRSDIGVLTDLEVQGNNLWLLYSSEIVRKLSFDGSILGEYNPLSIPGRMRTYQDQSLVLHAGGDGQMLLEQGYDSGYTIASESFHPNALGGYPANGKLYAKGDKPNVIIAGDLPIPIVITGTTLGTASMWHIFKVMPDSSFYVVVSATEMDKPELMLGRVQVVRLPDYNNYVMHYSADGKLLERARVPLLGFTTMAVAVSMKQLAISSSGEVYAISTHGGSTLADVLRLHFYPASEPLPPLPSATSIATSTPRATPEIADDTTLLFSIPVGKDGIHYITSTYGYGVSTRLGFAASAPDGTFWFQDGADRLAHYDPTGKRLGSIPLPNDTGEPREMQIRDSGFWLFYQEGVNSPEPAFIYHLAADGRQIAKYAVPDYVYRRTLGRMPSFLVGEQGQLLIRGDFTNLIPDSPQFPNPVPTEQMPQPQIQSKLYWQLSDAQGKATSMPLESYTYGGHTYTVRLPYPSGAISKGYIKVDNVEIDLTTTYPVTACDLLHVNRDGSFFVGVLEDEQAGDPYILTHYTIYHYSVQGELLERARRPLQGNFLNGYSASFHTIFEQPEWQQRGGKEPDKIEVRRLTFYPATQPLPTLPPPTATTPPLPTTTLPPPPREPGKINTDDLRDLRAASSIVVQGRGFMQNKVPNGYDISVEVQRWLWGSAPAETKTLDFFVHDDVWAKMPSNFRDDPMTQDRKQQSAYILFLSQPMINKDCASEPCTLPYFLTDGPAGAFMLSGGYIRDAGISKYNGWPVDAFIAAIADPKFITPTIAVPEETPTRVPGGEPVSLVRDGEGFRLDVHEGVAGFGLGIGQWATAPWIGSEHLAIRWSPLSEQGQSKSYLLNMVDGTLEYLPWSTTEWAASSSQDGKHVVLVGLLDKPTRINLLGMDTGKMETVLDLTPSAPQWAGADAHIWEFGTIPPSVYTSIAWLDPDTFVLSLLPIFNNQTTEYASKLLLVNTSRREVRVLAARGTLAEPLSNGVLLWQSGGLDGGLQILTPPFTGQPATIVPGGSSWIRDWTATPDGQRVAWVEAKALPGDWSHKLPYTCKTCGQKDPEPEVEAIAIWDRATGQTKRYPVQNLIWSLSDTNMMHRANLRWRNDGSALLYATHTADKGGAENAGSTALFELSPDGRSTLLSEHAWHGQLDTLWEGNDRSIYYYVQGEKSAGTGDIIRRHPDGKFEVLYTYRGWQAWTIDRDGYLEMLTGNSVTVTDLNTGDTRKATFSQVDPGQFDTGWGSIVTLVPMSPGAKWAAFAGSNSDAVIVSPDGTPDRGRTVYIVPVK